MLRTSFALASLGLVSSIHAGDTFYNLDGPQSLAFFGTSLGVGDLDADGIDDLVVGAPVPFSTHGQARAFSGRTGTQLFALSFAANSGRNVASGGDLNGDGRDDLVVSGDLFARVRSGADGSHLWAVANDHMDDKVLIIGDINFDNCADVVVGSPRVDNLGAIDAGVIRYYSGKTGALINSISGGGNLQNFGSRLANTGDVNNDGKDDFLVTSRIHLGGLPAVGVVWGGWNDVVTTIPALSNSSPEFGSALAGGKDFNNDGYDDIVVGDPLYDAPGATDNGRVHVYSGLNNQPLLTITGPIGSKFGSGVACVDDVNGDGRADIAIGAPEFVTVDAGVQVKGRVTIVSGANGATLKTWYAADNTSPYFGTVLAGMDANLDNYGDLAIGDRVATTPNSNSGRVIVKSGSFDGGGWGNWGVGYAGANSTPSLTGSGNMAICQQNNMIHLTNSSGVNTLPGLFFIGNSVIDFQTGYGGKLLVVPTVVVPVTVPAAGLNLPFMVCDTLLVNQQFRLQAVELDPGAPKGVSFSQGMWITLGM